MTSLREIKDKLSRVWPHLSELLESRVEPLTRGDPESLDLQEYPNIGGRTGPPPPILGSAIAKGWVLSKTGLRLCIGIAWLSNRETLMRRRRSMDYLNT